MNKLNLPVEEFTTPDPITASETTSIDELHTLMKEYGVRHLPILKSNKVVGVISDRDLKLAAGLSLSEKAQLQASHIMAQDPVAVKLNAKLDEVAFLMSKNKIGSVIVNEDDGTFYGIFTATDALNALIEIIRGQTP
ncbi:MAG: CBS domain-containing protein [Oligoflexia bacterium]|nr:CBS domain-containing protein [Oligoflexia bacterium]